MTRLQDRASILLLFTILLIIGYEIIYLFLDTGPLITIAAASSLSQNPNSECPPNSNHIWVRMNRSEYKFPNEPDHTISIPFDSDYVEINGHKYVNYLLGVLLREIGPASDLNPVDEELMKAKAILARTVAYKNCGIIFDGHPGMDDSDKQQYDPVRGEDWLNRLPDLVARYQAAIDATRGMYLTYNGAVFDAKYGSSSHEWTSGNTAPHVGVYDPAGRHHSTRTQEGLPQINANHYARGENHGEQLPPYVYRQLLGHYFDLFQFVGLDPPISSDQYHYLFNVLHFGQRYGGFEGGYDDRSNNPLVMRQGHTFTYDAIIQNTSDQSWPLACDSGVALSHHLYTYPDKRYLSGVYFEGRRNYLCPTGEDGASLEPGETFPSQASSARFMQTEIWIDDAVSPGDYWLRLDMEFPQVAWGSGLHPQNNPNNPVWPPQDIHIYVEKQQPDSPNPGVTSGHSYGSDNTTWSNNSTVQISWASVNDRLLDHYEVCWDKSNGGRECYNNGTNTRFSRTLPDGVYDFELTSVTADGARSNTTVIENIRIDATLPTAVLTLLPIRVQAFTHLMSWTSSDAGGSGLAENRFEYRLWRGNQLLVDWSRVDAVNNPAQTSILFDFPSGQHGDRYEFRLSVRDGADNWSNLSYTSTTFNPDPELHVRPPQLIWFSVYSNTLPKVEYLTIENYGGDTLNWTATTPFTLATLGQTEGTAPPITTIPVTLTHPVNITATYQGSIFVDSSTPGVHNASPVIPVTIYVLDKDNTQYLPVIFKQ